MIDSYLLVIAYLGVSAINAEELLTGKLVATGNTKEEVGLSSDGSGFSQYDVEEVQGKEIAKDEDGHIDPDNDLERGVLLNEFEGSPNDSEISEALGLNGRRPPIKRAKGNILDENVMSGRYIPNPTKVLTKLLALGKGQVEIIKGKIVAGDPVELDVINSKDPRGLQGLFGLLQDGQQYHGGQSGQLKKQGQKFKQRYHTSGRGLPGDGKTKGFCENVPREFRMGLLYDKQKMLACVGSSSVGQLPKDGILNADILMDWTGNYVTYTVKEEDHLLELDLVYTEYCKPKPEMCNCKELLFRVLQENKDVTKIKGIFAATPWEFGCNCYLGQAAKLGFKYVKLASEKVKCQDKREFNENNYHKVCAKYGKQKCVKNPPLGEITKT